MKVGTGVLLLGLVIVVVGAAIAVVTQHYADSMSDFTKVMKPDQYDTYMAIVYAGRVIVGIGLLLFTAGLVMIINPGNSDRAYSRQARAHADSERPSAINFCQFCGRRVSPGAAWCPACGKRLE